MPSSIFAVEGNIGAGKTTLLKMLESMQFHKKHIVFFEPVDTWTKLKDTDGKNIFEKFYEDEQKYAFMFQMFVLVTRFQQLWNLVHSHPDHVIIMERSYLADVNIFAKLMYEQKNLNDMEWFIYTSWYNMVSNMLNVSFKGLMYLKTTPKVCLERIRVRNRPGEEDIKLDYLEDLHIKHEEWINHSPSLPVLVVDANVSVDQLRTDDIISFINRNT